MILSILGRERMVLVLSSGILKRVNRVRDVVLVLVMMISISLEWMMRSVVMRKEAGMISEADEGNPPFLMVASLRMRREGGGEG